MAKLNEEPKGAELQKLAGFAHLVRCYDGLQDGRMLLLGVNRQKVDNLIALARANYDVQKVSSLLSVILAMSSLYQL